MAKLTMVPGTYPAGSSIPLTDTDLGCGSIYHESGSPIVQLKGSGCPRKKYRYVIGVGATMTSAGTTPEQIALMQDGVRIGLLSIDPAAAGETNTVSIPNEVGAVGSTKLSVEAVTAVTIAEGVLVVHRTV